MANAETLKLLLERGPMYKVDIVQRLGISEESLQEWLKELSNQIILIDKTNQIALLRKVGLRERFPIWEIDKNGKSILVGYLYPVYYEGYVMSWLNGHLKGVNQYSRALPWWLEDIRPQGFLGRVFVHKNAKNLNLSINLKDWSDDDVLKAQIFFGADSSGSYLVGNLTNILVDVDYANQLKVIESVCGKYTSISLGNLYSILAQQVLNLEPIGSSAAGEQPKFAVLAPKDNPVHVIVKFTAPDQNSITKRWGSLLQAEYLASKVLSQNEFISAKSKFLSSNSQWFLEVERFDRVGLQGRLSIVSLAAVDSEFVGQVDATWSIQAIELQKPGLISAEDAATMQKLEAFGRMIGNADMHLGNLSFFHEQTTNLRLAPVYDMLPMLFAPRAFGHIPNEVPEIRLVTPPALEYWQEMFPIALEYWQELIKLPQPDETFKVIAEKFIERLEELKPKLGL